MQTLTWKRSAMLGFVVMGVLTAAAATAQTGGETFAATATVKSPQGTTSVPITIHVNGFVADAKRDEILGIIKAHDAAATRQAFAKMADIGYIQVGTKRTPVKYAYARPTGGGRLITVITAVPVGFVGGAAPDAKPRDGFDLGLALLVLDGNNTGNGELSPAAKVNLNADGAVVTEDYGKETVHLTGVSKAK